MSEGRELRICSDVSRIFMARTLVKHYGEEAIDLLVDWKERKARERWAEIAQEQARTDPEYLFRLFSEDAHEFEVIHKERNLLEVKVTKCVHAEVFKQYNATDLGYKLICRGDEAVVKGFNPRIKFTRPEVLMRGDSCCHFRFELTD